MTVAASWARSTISRSSRSSVRTVSWELRSGVSCDEAATVIMLTVRDGVAVGLEVGADGYVTKPLEARELGFPGLGVDLLRREVVSQDGGVSYTATEFEVLALLVSSPCRVDAREQIMRHLRDGDFFGELRAAGV